MRYEIHLRRKVRGRWSKWTKQDERNSIIAARICAIETRARVYNPHGEAQLRIVRLCEETIETMDC